MTTVTLTDVSRNLSDYVNRVMYQHERFILTRGNKPVAELNPVPRGRTLDELEGLFKSLPHLSPEEADSFALDIEEARKTISNPVSPWEY